MMKNYFRLSFKKYASPPVTIRAPIGSELHTKSGKLKLHLECYLNNLDH